VLKGVSSSHLAPAALPTGEIPGTHWPGSCVDLQAYLDF